MRQIIKGNKKVLKYRWPKRPSMLRYHPKVQLYTFYSATDFAATDHFSGLTVVYQHDRDRGCFEVTRVGGRTGLNVFPAYKKFYVDYSPWHLRDPGEVEVVGMCLDENYQTLYVLFRQQMVNREHVEVWLARIEIGSVPVMVPLDLPGVPLFDFFLPRPVGPAVLTCLDDRMNFLTEKGWHCNIAAVKELNKAYNIVMTDGKLFITIPTIFDGPHDPDDTVTWVNRSNPCVVQVLMMFDSDYGILKGTGIIGALPLYSEAKYSPTPDNWPSHPLKIAMHSVDDCIVWTLADWHTLSTEWYDEHCQYWYRNGVGGDVSYADDAKRRFLPFITNMADCWVNANLPDRYWTLHRRESVHIKHIVREIEAGKATPLKPILYGVHNQFFIQHPAAFEFSDKSEIDRIGRALLMKWRQGFVGYSICYHNFHRKIIRKFENGIPPTYHVTDHEVGDFIYDGAGPCLSLDGETTYYQIFGLENLSSYTNMIDVTLTAPPGSTLLFGEMDGTPTAPSMTSISWERIKPHTEVLFTVCASEDTDNHWDGVGLEYGLEI